MSIKGTTQELYVGKAESNIITFMGNKINIPYSDVKRIDYCFAERFKLGFMYFIMKNNNINKFEFGFKANDPIKRTVEFIKEHSPSVKFRECQFGEEEKDRSIFVTPIFGHKELGLPLSGFTINQKPTGEIYFNKDTRTFYSLIGYEWEGPEFDTITKRSEYGNSNSQTAKKGKALKIGAGALLGNMVLPGVGAAVGAAMGAGSKGKSKTIGQNYVNSTETSSNVEKMTNGILTFKCHDDGRTYSLSFKCSSDLNARIKCFSFESEQVKDDIAADTSKSLEGIRALKELLDLGAITQEEFDQKKKALLDL